MTEAMLWIGLAVAGGIVGLIALGACVVAGRCDEQQAAMEAARQRELAKHEEDVEQWRILRDVAAGHARDGECAA